MPDPAIIALDPDDARFAASVLDDVAGNARNGWRVAYSEETEQDLHRIAAAIRGAIPVSAP